MAADQPLVSLALINRLTEERDQFAHEAEQLRAQCHYQASELQHLHTQIDELQHQRLRLFAQLITAAPDGIVMSTLDGVITYANHAFQAMTGYGDELIGMHLNELIVVEERRFVPAVVQRLAQVGTWQGTRTYLRRDGRTFEANISLVLIRDDHGQPQMRAAIIRDLTRQRRLEQEQLLLQERVIAEQQLQLRDLSAPVLRLSAHVVMVPISGNIDAARAEEIVEGLLSALARQTATLAIVDVSGQAEISQPVATLLLRAGQALRLLGTAVIITGDHPSLQPSLAILGLKPPEIAFYPSLQAGVDAALRLSSR